MSKLISVTLLLLLSCFTAFVSAGYDVSLAKEYASASALAYCDPSTIQSWTCGDACKNLTGYQSYFTKVFNVAPGETLSFSMILNPSEKKFVTAFRGTASTEQLLLEVLEGDAVNYQLTNIPNALVDDYFNKHYVNSLRPTFLTEFKAALSSYSDYQFIFTGHSLGGALTTLAAFDVVSSGLISSNKMLLYNYGSPRVGNHVLAEAIEAAIANIYRVVHWKDIVPHLPPCSQSSTGGQCVQGDSNASDPQSLQWPAWHVTQNIFYNEDNSQYKMCSGGEDPTCGDQFTLGQASINDHSYYVGIHLSCDGTSAISLSPSQAHANLEDSMEQILNKRINKVMEELRSVQDDSFGFTTEFLGFN